MVAKACRWGGRVVVVVLLLLQGCRLQHQMLLLGCVHLLQQLRRQILRSILEGMLDEL